VRDVDSTKESEESTVTDNLKVCADTMSRAIRIPSPTSIIQIKYTVNTMINLRYSGLESLVQELLATDGVHDPGKLLSFETNVHTCFDNLEPRFEGTDKVVLSGHLRA
jgi:hypothetical protein